MSDPVGGHLKHVFKQGNSPADECGDNPRPVGKISQVAVPGKGHKYIAEAEQQGSDEIVVHWFFKSLIIRKKIDSYPGPMFTVYDLFFGISQLKFKGKIEGF